MNWRREDDDAIALAARLWQAAGARVPVELAGLTRRLGMTLLLRPAPAGVRGVLLRATPPIIMVNSTLSLASQRYALAHEIAHALIDRGALTVRAHRQERICQLFAAALLMPPHLLVPAAHAMQGRHDALAELAGQFVVSREAMRIQLRRLRLLLPAAPAYTPEARAAARHPFDDHLHADLTLVARCRDYRAFHQLPVPTSPLDCTRCPAGGGCPLTREERELMWER